MSNAVPLPALPWGIPEAAPAAPVATGPKLRLSPSDVGLTAGDSIEVLWEYTSEGAQPVDRWWRATLVGPSEQKPSSTPGDEQQPSSTPGDEPRNAQSGPSFDIMYEPFEGFENERATVYFTSKRRLLDEEQGAKMIWRRPGGEAAPGGDDSSAYEDSDEEEEEEEEGGVEGGEGATFTLQEYNDAMDREEGVSNGDAEVTAFLATMAPDKARRVAEGMMDFQENLSSFLAQTVERKRGAGLDATITKDDVLEFNQSMAAKRRRGE